MESNSDNSSAPGRDHSRRHSSGRTHSRHHRHSSHRHYTSSKPYRYEKRPRLEDRPKREHQKKIESFFIRNILIIFGMIFIAGAIWFGIENWKSFSSQVGLSFEKSKIVEMTMKSKTGAVKSSILTPVQLRDASSLPDTSSVLFLILPLVFILASLGLSFRRKNILLKIISFTGWILIASGMLIKFFITADVVIFYSILILSTLFFILFFVSGFLDSYIGKTKWKFRSEYFLILFNSLFYFFIIMTVLHKTGHRSYDSVFVFLLSALLLFSFYYTDKRNLTYNKIPYLISALIITCSFLPLIFRVNLLIIFLSPLSVFLILFSKYSRNQTSVIFSLTAMVIMVLNYIYQWAYQYIPDILLADGISNNTLFFKGLISSLFILLPFSINYSYLKKNTVTFHPKWLVKIKYLKIIRGLFLLMIYLTGYWVFSFLVHMIILDERINLLVWFSFNCIYFIFYIPRLAWQRSSFFRIMIIVAMISSLACFTFVHFNNLLLRNLFLESEGTILFPLLFHYIPLALLMIMLVTLLRYFKKAFPGKKTLIKGFWIYFYSICTFLLLSEFDHLAVLYGYHNRIMINLLLDRTQRLPYSLLMILTIIVVITIGFIIKSRFLRIFSLLLLGIVLVKILVYDVGYLDSQSKMILFFLLGIFLFGTSLFYPKIKNSFFRKDSPSSHTNHSTFPDVRKHRN
jgi:hypothetical protein